MTMEAEPSRGQRRAGMVPRHRLQRTCFHVSQAFFPRTSAWDNLKKALRGTYEEASGTIWRAPPARRLRRAISTRLRSR